MIAWAVDALAGAGLPHDRKRLSTLDGQRNAFNRLDQAILRGERNRQVGDLEKWPVERAGDRQVAEREVAD